MTQPLDIPGIVALASAFHGPAVLFAALETGVFEAIEKCGGSADLDSVAAATGCSRRGLRLLLDACAAAGLLAKDGPGGPWRNTPAGRMALVPGAPADLSGAIAYNRDVYGAWGRVAELARTGRPVEPPALHLGDDPERTRRFAASMRGRALAIGRGIVPMVDLSGCRRLLDLAGGPGAYATLLARANPGLSAVTLDLPAISAAAREFVAADGLSERVECRAGDWHDESDDWGEGEFDAVTIFGALHQESPDSIRSILRRSFRALRPGGSIHVLDVMTDDTHASPPFSAMFAVNMALTADNGWVFSDSELRSWMGEAGFEPGRTRPAPPPMPHWLVSARRP